MIMIQSRILYCLWIRLSIAVASSFDEPHPHTGSVQPYKPGDPGIKLDSAAEKILSSNQPYQTQIKTGNSGRGLVVQDVQAPMPLVWKRILDYDHYADMVPRTLASSNYDVMNNKDGSQEIYTRMKVGISLISLEFFIKHSYYPQKNSLTWTLDYMKKSDFDDIVGFWYIIEHPSKPNWTRVYYSVSISMFSWVPKIAMDFMSSKALTDATSWVKKESEAQALTLYDDIKKEGVPRKQQKSLFKMLFSRKKVSNDETRIDEKAEENAMKEKERQDNDTLLNRIYFSIITANLLLGAFLYRGIKNGSK